MKKFLKVIGIIFLVLIVLGIIGALLPDDESAETSSEQSGISASNDKSKWKYSHSINEMDNVRTDFAELDAENKLEFEFPYNGGSTFTFVVRKTNGKYTLLLIVDKGQFMSNVLGDERLRIKFDDGETFQWNYTDTNDGRSNIIFPTYTDEFLTALKKSKSMLIEAPFAFAGRQVVRFKTENLNADF